MELAEKKEKIKSLLAAVMAGDAYRTVQLIAADLQTEYPEEYRDFVVVFTNAHNLHGCGYRRGHINAITTVLEEMEATGAVERKHEGGNSLWRKRP